MGQSASLYPVTAAEFELLKANSDLTELPDISERAETFEKSFEGLQFVLAKCFDGSDRSLVSEIFYPNEFLGEEPDYGTMDFDNYEETEEPLYYLSPQKVQKINTLISGLTEAVFISRYDSAELNDNEVYPENWDDSEDSNRSCNSRHLAEQFAALQIIFSEAAAGKNYLLVYIG